MKRFAIPLATILVACFVAGSAVAAPVVQVLEDFEGQLVGWGSSARVDADPVQGSKAFLWQTTATDGPQFHYFDFSSRGVELIEWDRLVFDYKFGKPGCQWWGVKIIDFPLGDGMQATWQIADRGGITPGEWQTAVIDLQHPTWLWGDKPDKNSQQIHFRCQLAKGSSSPVSIDNVRLERDPIRIDSVEPEGTQSGADGISVIYKIVLANATGAPARIGIGTRDASAGLTVTLQSDEVTIPAGGQSTVYAHLAAKPAGDTPAQPLTRLTAEFCAVIADQKDTEKTTTMSLAIPLAEVEHPSLLITRQQAAQVLQRMQGNDELKAIYDSIKRQADGWLSKAPDYPDRGGQWWHWYTCKKCGSQLQTKSPTEHACPDCGEVYSGWPYDDVVLDRQHGALAQAIRDCGLMYTFTGDERYAAKSREILMGYAERYLKYPLHNINGEPKKGGGHVGPQTLDESTWLIPVAQGFDCIYETLSEEDIKFIADNMLLPAAELIHDHQWGIHNICCWHASAYGLVGITLGNQRLASDAIEGPMGFRAQIEQGVTDDGFWYESAWGYHFYTMMALQPLAIAARNVGIDLYSERYKSMYDAPLLFMAPAGILPAFNDSGRANALGGGNRYEISYARWKDPRHLLPILNGRRNSHETLLFGTDLGDVDDFVLGSTLFPAAGYVVLRSGERGEGGASTHIPENYVCLDYGPHGGGHGHPDKLGFVLYGMGELLAEDPGCIAYGNPAHGGWYRQTISHSTVVVNGTSQKPCTGALQFSAFGDGIGICSARADDAYPEARLRRTMALVGDRVIDIFACDADEDVTFDWAYHNRGALTTSVELSSAQAPKGDGYDWAKEWRSGDTTESWTAVWQNEEGPGVALAQAAGGQRTVLTAMGMGNPPRIKVPFVVSRVSGKSALFCSAVQIVGKGQAAPELAVRVLPVQTKEAARSAEPPVAVEVSGGGTRDIVLANPAGGELRAGELQLVGQAAVLRYVDDKLEQILVAGDSRVYVGDKLVGPAR